MSERAVLLDNVVLSNFLLADAQMVPATLLAERAWVTPEVLSENAAGRATGHTALARIDDLLARGVVREVVMSTAERRTFVSSLSSLGRGEASCIAVAEHRGASFASDDRVARQAAAARGVALTGSIGILVAAVRRRLLSADDADAMLTRMIAAGFFSPVRSIQGLL